MAGNAGILKEKLKEEQKRADEAKRLPAAKVQSGVGICGHV